TATSKLFAAENPKIGTGCIAGPDAYVELIDPFGSESSRQHPCFEHPVLTDLLDAKGVSWKYYAPLVGSIWTAPNAIRHMCEPEPMQDGLLGCSGKEWQHIILPQTQVLSDIANSKLAQVSWVIPNGQASDHAMITDGSGPSWVASIVNAIGNSPYWRN